MSKYKANETMRLLGHQYWVDAEAREQIDAFLVKKILDFLVTNNYNNFVVIKK